MLAHAMSIRGNKDKKVRFSPYKPRIIQGNWRVWLHSFLTSELDTGEWSTSRPSRFILWGKRSGYSMNRGQGGPQSYFGRLGQKEKFLAPDVNRPYCSLLKGFLITNSHFLDTLVPKTPQN
jgi:hypothetical protein